MSLTARTAAKKAEKTLGVLAELGPLPTSADAAAWPENVWADLAKAAGINSPSEKTRAFVVAQLRLQVRS